MKKRLKDFNFKGEFLFIGVILLVTFIVIMNSICAKAFVNIQIDDRKYTNYELNKVTDDFLQLYFINDNDINDNDVYLSSEQLNYVSLLHHSELKNNISENVYRFKDLIKKEAQKDYWSYIYQEYDLTYEHIVSIMLTIAQLETGGELKPESNSTGAGWGLFQIENIGGKIRSSKVKEDNSNIDVKISITSNQNTDERLNPEKSIEWAAAHLYNLILFFEGDLDKAIQGYNFGAYALNRLIDKHQDNWIDNLSDIRNIMNRGSYGDPEYLLKFKKVNFYN